MTDTTTFFCPTCGGHITDHDHNSIVCHWCHALWPKTEEWIRAGVEANKNRLRLLHQVCPRCHGQGVYYYDQNHGKPCEVCCKHDGGWWDLTEHHAGYVAGGDNACCLLGCGTLRRMLGGVKP